MMRKLAALGLLIPVLAISQQPEIHLDDPNVPAVWNITQADA